MKQFKDITLLYVEDDLNIRNNYCYVFKQMFQDVHEASGFEEALLLYKNFEIDILIVDINLNSSKSGIDLIKKIRLQDLNSKIIITSAYSTIENLLEVSSLNLSDFLVKPVEEKSLYEALENALQSINTIKIINYNIITLDKNLVWDFNKKELIKDGVTINLTKTEKDILNVILLNPSIELTYDNIINDIWDYDDKNHIETLRTLVSNIRKKLPKNTIKTLYNIGYRYK